MVEKINSKPSVKNSNYRCIITIVLAIIFVAVIFQFFLIDNTDKKVMEYLNSKYGEEFENLTLIEKKNKKVSTGIEVDGSVFYKNKPGCYEYYYTAYSKKENITFDIICLNDNKKYSFQDTYSTLKNNK